MKTIEEYSKELLLPQSRAEVDKWARHYYDTVPQMRSFVDFVYADYDHPPTAEEITLVVRPYFKLLVYKDYLRQAA